MHKIAEKICKHRKLILIIALLLLIPSIIGMKATRINYDILVYLPEDIETIKGEDILSEDFDMGGFSVVLLEDMSTKDIVKLEEKIRKIVETVLRKVKLWDRRKASPSRLSGGQKQRLATADALAGLPACLVLDEPTAMLDPDSRKEVINIVKELNRKEGMTIILITHHTDEVVDADRIVLMKDGKIIGDDIPKKIFADYELLKKAKMDIPPVVELGMRLEKQQIGLEGPVLQEQEMIEKIVKLYRSKCGGKKDAAR
mgnify:CR=1 FL=1